MGAWVIGRGLGIEVREDRFYFHRLIPCLYSFSFKAQFEELAQVRFEELVLALFQGQDLELVLELALAQVGELEWGRALGSEQDRAPDWEFGVPGYQG